MESEQAVRQLRERAESFARDAATFRAAHVRGVPITENDILWASAYSTIATELRTAADLLRRNALYALSRPIIQTGPITRRLAAQDQAADDAALARRESSCYPLDR